MAAILNDFGKENVFKNHLSFIILNWFWCEFRANIIINNILKIVAISLISESVIGE